MARKKRKSGGEGEEPGPAGPPAGLPSRREIEQMMRQLVGGLPGAPAPDTPLARAEALVDAAAGEPDPKRRLELAHEALRASPDCADAHVLLAEHAPTRRQALAHYEQAVAAGERAVGSGTFRDGVGHFWGLLETRPYMRARLGLAHALWTAARRDGAVEHLRDMLRLNPNDNQGVRYTLAGFLLFLDRDDDLARLIDQYPDDGSAAWDYTRALLAFRRVGDADESRKLLKRAVKTNRHVPAYLLGTKFPPADPPDYYTPGDENEAVEYVGGFLAGWKSTAGAVAWLRASVAKPQAPPKAKGPAAAAKRAMNKLPQESDAWQADCRRLPVWVPSGGHLVRPWAVLVTSRTDGLVLAHEMSEGTPTPGVAWDALAAAVRKPLAGGPHRPATLQVRAGSPWEGLRPHVEDLGIEVEAAEELDQLDRMFESLAEQVGGDSGAGLLDMPGMTPERVRGFYEAAAEYYRLAPWKRVGYESAIRVECRKFESGPWYAVPMGQSGLTVGLALYEDIGVLRRMWAGNEGDEENARETVGTSVTFGEEWDVPPADVDAAERYGWPVARPDAYPEVFRKERGLSMRPPLAWELELLEGCLRAVPAFVGRRGQDDPTPEEFAVPTAGGGLTLLLSWVPDDDGPSPDGSR